MLHKTVMSVLLGTDNLAVFEKAARQWNAALWREPEKGTEFCQEPYELGSRCIPIRASDETLAPGWDLHRSPTEDLATLSRLLIHRNYEITNVCCFQSLSLQFWCYVTADNRVLVKIHYFSKSKTLDRKYLIFFHYLLNTFVKTSVFNRIF